MSKKQEQEIKQVTVRVPIDLWRKVMHRMIDEERDGWQGLIMGGLEAYVDGTWAPPAQEKEKPSK